ncbi:MAG: hypothetical protein F6J93_38810 [Oscillatoria sp. SIO1A7]|nr:hypothetical protein [Oscillatoria sp. SIO1A7]
MPKEARDLAADEVADVADRAVVKSRSPTKRQNLLARPNLEICLLLQKYERL